MQSISLQNLTAFLCIMVSLIAIGSDRKETKASPAREHRFIQPSRTSLWSGKPASELEAQMYFYMRPTAKEVIQRREQYLF